MPVSTTHTIAGAITATGIVRRLGEVRWSVAKGIAWAWVLTLPGAAFIAAAAYLGVRILGIGS